ncbi:hypothetical protein CWI36_1826p0010 [Hamiltosporidium magnivora]|uniref:Uncharacterized protein n=1 Tax=Hamiltosporidium magnivora TaxID=148818 RepID=A0A4Q9KYT2_9MICR|nr:hypothetical protein CWI36_2621p0010 [Hamiltosporidium magnivora]TBT99855.1 hypothetical protein CWI36_1826p0010 [Hamiltosporidium magnivora]
MYKHNTDLKNTLKNTNSVYEAYSKLILSVLMYISDIKPTNINTDIIHPEIYSESLSILMFTFNNSDTFNIDANKIYFEMKVCKLLLPIILKSTATQKHVKMVNKIKNRNINV